MIFLNLCKEYSNAVTLKIAVAYYSGLRTGLSIYEMHLCVIVCRSYKLLNMVQLFWSTLKTYFTQK